MGIHGLHRPRTWDEVVVVRAPRLTGDAVVLVALADGSVHVESGGPAQPGDLAPLLSAVDLRRPCRIEAHRRDGDSWAVGAARIRVVQLPPDQAGEEIEVVWDGAERSVRVDDRPILAGVPELERLASHRFAAWVVRARRLRDTFWEVESAPL